MLKKTNNIIKIILPTLKSFMTCFFNNSQNETEIGQDNIKYCLSLLKKYLFFMYCKKQN